MKKPSKKLYQKVTSKPKKVKNNNVNSINIILNPHEERGSARPSGGAGPQVLQELSRITPPSLEDARQILARFQQRDPEAAKGATISGIREKGFQTEAVELVDNAQQTEVLSQQNEQLVDEVEQRNNLLGALSREVMENINVRDEIQSLRAETENDIDNINEELRLLDTELTLHTNPIREVSYYVPPSAEQLSPPTPNEGVLSQLQETISNNIKSAVEQQLLANATEQLTRVSDLGMDEINALRNQLNSLENVTGEFVRMPSVSVSPSRTPPPSAGLGFFGEPEGRGPIFSPPQKPRVSVRETLVPRTRPPVIDGGFGNYQDIPERAQVRPIPRGWLATGRERDV